MMRNTIVMVIALAITSVAAPTIEPTAAAQGSEDQPKVLGIMNEGNTSIVFESADTSESIPMNLYHIWSEFAELHPGIARELGNQPSLLSSKAYLMKHPELEAVLVASSKASRGDA